MIAIIGGSGVYEGIDGLCEERKLGVETPFGAVECAKAVLNRTEVVFLSRHGEKEKLPPHRVPYKAQMRALKELGVDRILATSAVGSLDKEIPLGSLVLPDQFIDFTKTNRTFYEGGESGLVHLDMSEPFCPDLRKALSDAGKGLGLNTRTGGVYACIDGPHFETLAEARMLRNLGGTIAGMTAVPEAKLARELEICYQVAAIPVDYPAEKEGEVSHAQTLKIMGRSTQDVARLIAKVIEQMPQQRDCVCSSALKGTEGLKPTRKKV